MAKKWNFLSNYGLVLTHLYQNSSATLREIARSGYAGWITVELYPYVDNPDDAGREAKEFLEGVWERKDEG